MSLYPTRCQIIDPTGDEVVPGYKAASPPEAEPHVGKRGLAEEIGEDVRITLDDGTVIWGYECWWEPIADSN